MDPITTHPGGLITKLSKQPRTESKIFILKFWKWRRFLKEHYSLSPSKKTVFSSKTRIRFAANCSNYGAHFMAAIPLSLNNKATITTAVLSLAYKSQRKTVKKGGATRQRGEQTEKVVKQPTRIIRLMVLIETRRLGKCYMMQRL